MPADKTQYFNPCPKVNYVGAMLNLVLRSEAVISTELTASFYRMVKFTQEEGDQSLQVNLDELESIQNHAWGV